MVQLQVEDLNSDASIHLKVGYGGTCAVTLISTGYIETGGAPGLADEPV